MVAELLPLQTLSTGRRLCWPSAVLIWPIEAPIKTAGMWSNEFFAHGRDAQ